MLCTCSYNSLCSEIRAQLLAQPWTTTPVTRVSYDRVHSPFHSIFHSTISFYIPVQGLERHPYCPGPCMSGKYTHYKEMWFIGCTHWLFSACDRVWVATHWQINNYAWPCTHFCYIFQQICSFHIVTCWIWQPAWKCQYEVSVKNFTSSHKYTWNSQWPHSETVTKASIRTDKWAFLNAEWMNNSVFHLSHYSVYML